MIISHKHKFIFIKTVKTAGTSIEVFLSQHCGESDIVTPIIPPVDPHMPRNATGYYNHMPAFEIRRTINPLIWNNYYKFCVERNPWDKTLSYYHMANYRSHFSLTFEDYLASKQFPVNYPWYTEQGHPGSIIIDRVIHYESLTSDLSEIFKTLGIPFAGSLGVNAKSEYRTDRRPYREIYTPDQAQLIANHFQLEIQLHGYVY
jgi:hypothetical protein